MADGPEAAVARRARYDERAQRVADAYQLMHGDAPDAAHLPLVFLRAHSEGRGVMIEIQEVRRAVFESLATSPVFEIKGHKMADGRLVRRLTFSADLYHAGTIEIIIVEEDPR